MNLIDSPNITESHYKKNHHVCSIADKYLKTSVFIFKIIIFCDFIILPLIHTFASRIEMGQRHKR